VREGLKLVTGYWHYRAIAIEVNTMCKVLVTMEERGGFVLSKQ